jgi:hypothetical protein
VAVIASLLLWLLGCSGARPEVLQSDGTLFLVDDLESGQRYESIRLFVAVNDENGVDDIGVVYVDHADQELYWEFDASTWVQFEFAGDTWIGMPDMRMPHSEAVPRGRYRVIVEDLALQRTEGQFSVTADPVDLDGLVFPRLVTSPRLEVVASRPVVLRVYTRSGQMPVNGRMDPGPVPADLLERLPDESGLIAYLTMDGEDGAKLISGPYDVPR